MVHVPVIAGLRRTMRRHQGLPAGRRRPMWRLLAGEVAWATRQLLARPLVPLVLVLGFGATLAVLDTEAPGPVLDTPLRLLVAVGAGVLAAAGVHGLRGLVAERRDGAGSGARDGARPVVGASVIAGLATIVILLAWTAAWVVDLVT